MGSGNSQKFTSLLRMLPLFRTSVIIPLIMQSLFTWPRKSRQWWWMYDDYNWFFAPWQWLSLQQNHCRAFLPTQTGDFASLLLIPERQSVGELSYFCCYHSFSWLRKCFIHSFHFAMSMSRYDKNLLWDNCDCVLFAFLVQKPFFFVWLRVLTLDNFSLAGHYFFPTIFYSRR